MGLVGCIQDLSWRICEYGLLWPGAVDRYETPARILYQGSDPVSWFSFGIGLVILAVVLVLFMAAPIFAAVWIYRDATRRNDASAAVWAVGAVLAWPVALIVYLILRNQGQHYPR